MMIRWQAHRAAERPTLPLPGAIASTMTTTTTEHALATDFEETQADWDDNRGTTDVQEINHCSPSPTAPGVPAGGDDLRGLPSMA